MSTYSQAPTLEGAHIRLEQLSPAHKEDLRVACADGELWKLWYTSVPEPSGIAAQIRGHLDAQAAGKRAPWAVVDKRSSKAIGVTTFLGLAPEHRRLEIGHTWYAGSAQGTLVNAEAKYLLLTRAFSELQAHRVEWRVHWFNHRSRAAVEKLGAKLDGVLRKHTIMANGTVRDTCVYSLIDDDWPTARFALEHRLGLL